MAALALAQNVNLNVVGPTSPILPNAAVTNGNNIFSGYNVFNGVTAMGSLQTTNISDTGNLLWGYGQPGSPNQMYYSGAMSLMNGLIQTYTNGYLSAQNVTGTVVTATSKFVGNVAGNVTGNVTGSSSTTTVATNVVNGAISSSNLDNTTWLQLQAASLQDANHFNAYAWSRPVMQKVAGQKNIRLEMDGTGLVGGNGLLNWCFMWFTNNSYTCNGYYTWFQSRFVPYYDTNKTALANESSTIYGLNTNWFTFHYIMTNSGSVITNLGRTLNDSGPLPWSIFEIEAKFGPTAGNLLLQTNTSGTSGNYVTATTFNLNSNVTVVRSLFWTNSITMTVGSCLANSAQVTNEIMSCGEWDGNVVSNAMTIGQQAASASSTAYFQLGGPPLLAPSNNMTVGYSSWQPDVIFWNSIESVGGIYDIQTNFPSLLRFYSNACPNAALVICGTYPVGAADTTNSVLAENTYLRSAVSSAAYAGQNVSFFNGYAVMQSFTNELNRGFFNNSADTNVHMGVTGNYAYDYLLNSWMDFRSSPLATPASLTATNCTFTGNTTLTNITLNNAQVLWVYDAYNGNYSALSYFVSPLLNSGNTYYPISFGFSPTTANFALIAFNYVGNGSANNSFEFVWYAGNTNITFYENGNANMKGIFTNWGGYVDNSGGGSTFPTNLAALGTTTFTPLTALGMIYTTPNSRGILSGTVICTNNAIAILSNCTTHFPMSYGGITALGTNMFSFSVETSPGEKWCVTNAQTVGVLVQSNCWRAK